MRCAVVVDGDWLILSVPLLRELPERVFTQSDQSKWPPS
jgi:hypothetical protein